jgi:hypothetical protein
MKPSEDEEEAVETLFILGCIGCAVFFWKKLNALEDDALRLQHQLDALRDQLEEMPLFRKTQKASEAGRISSPIVEEPVSAPAPSAPKIPVSEEPPHPKPPPFAHPAYHDRAASSTHPSDAPARVRQPTPSQRVDSVAVETETKRSREVLKPAVQRPSHLLQWLKALEQRFVENWIGIVGSLVMVVGVGFFGLYAALRVTPFVRFFLIDAFALLCFILSAVLLYRQRWRQLALWLRSSAGAIFLFACLGSGGIPGLQWVEEEMSKHVLLGAGIVANLCLAYVGGEVFSSIHVLLSLAALMLPQQGLTTMVAAGAVAAFGVLLTFREKREVQLLATTSMFFAFNTFWCWRLTKFSLSKTAWFWEVTHRLPMISHERLAGILSTAIVGVVALLVHYTRIYANQVFDRFAFGVHLMSWTYLGVGLLYYSIGSVWRTLFLALGSAMAFVIAQRAKRRGIVWLHLTDTLIAQGIALLAIISLTHFEVDQHLLALIALAETILYTLVTAGQGDRVASSVGMWLTHLAALVVVAFGIIELTNSETRHWVMASLAASTFLMALFYALLVRKPKFDLLRVKGEGKGLEVFKMRWSHSAAVTFLALGILTAFSLLEFQVAIRVALIISMAEGAIFSLVMIRQRDSFTSRVGVRVVLLAALVLAGMAIVEFINPKSDPGFTSILASATFLMALFYVLLAWRPNAEILRGIGEETGSGLFNMRWSHSAAVTSLVLGIVTAFSLLEFHVPVRVALLISMAESAFFSLVMVRRKDSFTSKVGVKFTHLAAFVMVVMAISEFINPNVDRGFTNVLASATFLMALFYALLAWRPNADILREMSRERALEFLGMRWSHAAAVTSLVLGIVTAFSLLVYQVPWAVVLLAALAEILVFILLMIFLGERVPTDIGYWMAILASLALLTELLSRYSSFPLGETSDLLVRVNLTALAMILFTYVLTEKTPLRKMFPKFQNGERVTADEGAGGEPHSLPQTIPSSFLLTVLTGPLGAAALYGTRFSPLGWVFGPLVSAAFLLVRAWLPTTGLALASLIMLASQLVYGWMSIEFSGNTGLWERWMIVAPVLMPGIVAYLWPKHERRPVLWPSVCYAGIHLLLSVFYVFQEISYVIPAVLCLLISLLYLESAGAYERRRQVSERVRIGRLDVLFLQSGYVFLAAFLFTYFYWIMAVESYLGFFKLRLMVELLGIGGLLYWALTDRKILHVWPGRKEGRLGIRPWLWEVAVGFSIMTVALELDRQWHPLFWSMFSIVLLLTGRKWSALLSRFRLYSLFMLWASAVHVAVVTRTVVLPTRAIFSQPWFLALIAVLLQFVYLYLLYGRRTFENVGTEQPCFSFWKKVADGIGRYENKHVYYPVFVCVGLFFLWSFSHSFLTLLWVFECLIIFVLGITLRETQFRYIAQGFLVFCLLRLVFYDLATSGTIVKAVVFIGVGIMMLLIYSIYNRYRIKLEKDSEG